MQKQHGIDPTAAAGMTVFGCLVRNNFVPWQVESTVAMQNIAPQVKAIQEEYKGRDQTEMQIKVGELYKKAGVNPLAGCLPTLATLPVWIGLYRCVSAGCCIGWTGCMSGVVCAYVWLVVL